MPRGLKSVLSLVVLLPVLLVPFPPASAELLLNEVLYDPAGADEGFEFVELWNQDTVAVSLAGILVESGDGARPGVWATVYAGAASDSVPPRSAFLIPGSALLASLQNGPDALRLSRAGVALDLLGYGALAAAELFEGAPAEDAPSGQSLARTVDGGDTGSNAADWSPEPDPTPGVANHPDVRLAIRHGSASIEPEVPWPGDAAILRVTVGNRGRLSVPASRWQIEVAVRSTWDGDSSWPAIPVAISPGATLSPGESTEVRCEVTAPAPGRFELRATLRDLARGAYALIAAGTARAETPALSDTVWIRSRSTAAPLLINEIAFRDRGAGEWVELLAREAIPDVGAFTLSDAGGRAYSIDRGPAPRAARAGELLVVAQSPALVRASYFLPDSAVLGCRGGWASLNDTDGDDGFADRVRVVDSLGIVCDAAPYRSEYAERHGSIERLGVHLPSASSNSWAESIDPRAGTPGAPNSLSAPERGARSQGALLFASSRMVRRLPGAAAVPVVLALGEAARGRKVRVLVHDLLGRARRRLIDGQRVLGEAALVWDGRDDAGEPVPAGIYVVRGETIPEGDEPARSESLALTVVDRWGR